MKAAVVIPIYKTELTEIEKISLNQCKKVLGNYDVFYASPKGLNPQERLLPFKNAEFDPKYFKSIEGYNRLMLESHFYERFLKYDYILIYQLDAFVFKDELATWCKKNYDYIGSPWIATQTPISKLLNHFASKKIKKRAPIFFKVGNGGFSLRKTKTFYEISKKLENKIQKQLEKKDEIYAIEDVFWSLKVPTFFPEFSIPNYIEAVKFSIDRKPELALKINKNELPFGCHGINKPKVIKFWMPIINNAIKDKD